MSRRVGLLGGVFDPIHNGHIQLALVAIDQSQLDEVILLPTADPPHKSQPIASFDERAHMVGLAIERLGDLRVSRIEESLNKPSYTIDTLYYFLDNLFEDDVALYFILGLDAFLDIESWYLYERILELTNLVVVVRVGFDATAFKDLAVKLGFVQKSSVNWHHVEKGTSIHFIFEPPIEISSTEIREKAFNNVSLCELMPKNVVNYIKENKLYQDNRK